MTAPIFTIDDALAGIRFVHLAWILAASRGIEANVTAAAATIEQIDPKEFERSVLSLSKTKRNVEVLDYVYARIDRVAMAGQFGECDNLIRSLSAPNSLPLSILVGILTVTLDWKHSLPSRGTLFKTVQDLAVCEMGKRQARELLLGLE